MPHSTALKLVVGFDAAWTAGNEGAVVAVLRGLDGAWTELGIPQGVDFSGAASCIRRWQEGHTPATTLILLDQPTIVPNAAGSRPVEHLVSSPVSRRLGGVQPANTGKQPIFGPAAPRWAFLEKFGGAADPFAPLSGTRVLETYPVLAIIARGWCLPHPRRASRLPKYDPRNRGKFSLADWRHVCERAAEMADVMPLPQAAVWLRQQAVRQQPVKADQDAVDAYLCLLVGTHLASGAECMVIGDVETGYMVVSHDDGLHAELATRCQITGREAGAWLRRCRLVGNSLT